MEEDQNRGAKGADIERRRRESRGAVAIGGVSGQESYPGKSYPGETMGVDASFLGMRGLNN